MILNEDFFDGMDSGNLSSDFEEMIPDIEIETDDKSKSPDAYTHKLTFQINGIRRSKKYETNIERMHLIYKYLKMLIDKCPLIESSSEVYIVFKNWYSKDEDTINEFRGMLIQCDPKFLQPECIVYMSNGKEYNADTVFNTSSLNFCIGVNTTEIDTVKKADQFVNYLYIIWEKTVMAAVEKRAKPNFITDRVKRPDDPQRKYIGLNMGYSDVFRNHNQKFFRQWYDVVRRVVEPDVKLDKKLFVNYYNGVKDDPYYEYKRYMELIGSGFEINVNEQNKTVEIYVPEKARWPKWNPRKSPSKLLKKTQQQFPGYELRIIEPKDTGSISFRAESLDELNNILDMFGNVINSKYRVEISVPKYDMSKFPGGPKIKLNVRGTGGIGFYFISTTRPAGGPTPIRWQFYSDSGVEIRNPYFYGY